MILKKAEHITRYTLHHDGNEYLRLVEEGLSEESVTWMVYSDQGISMLSEPDSDSLEVEFLKTVQ